MMIKSIKQLFWQSIFSLIAVAISLSSNSVVFADNLPAIIENNSSDRASSFSRELFQNAYENRYTWDSEFPGYTADVELKMGKEIYKGKIQVTSKLNVDVTGIEAKDARENVKNQVLMLVIHRRQIPFEAAHGSNNFSILSTDAKGVANILQQGKTEARYKIYRDKIVQVNRTLAGNRVTVDLLESEQTPEGYLATRYKTIFRQPESEKVVGLMEQKDSYEKIAKYYIPDRVITQETDEAGQKTVLEFNFTNISLTK